MQKFALVLSGSKTITITAVRADPAADSELAWHEQLRRPKNGTPASRPRPPRRQTEPPESLPQRQSPPHEARAVRSSERESAGGGHRAGPLQPSRGGAGGDDARVCVSRGGQPSTVRGEQDGSLDLSCRLAALEAKVAGWVALPQVRLPDSTCACGLGLPVQGRLGMRHGRSLRQRSPAVCPLSGHSACASRITSTTAA